MPPPRQIPGSVIRFWNETSTRFLPHGGTKYMLSECRVWFLQVRLPTVFLKFFFVGHIHMSYFGATGTPVLDFCRRLLLVFSTSDRIYQMCYCCRKLVILGSGCGSGFSGADLKSCDLSEPIRCAKVRIRSRIRSRESAPASTPTSALISDWLRQITWLQIHSRESAPASAPENPLPHPLPFVM